MKCVLLLQGFEYNPVIFGTFEYYCFESGKRMTDKMISEQTEKEGEGRRKA